MQRKFSTVSKKKYTMKRNCNKRIKKSTKISLPKKALFSIKNSLLIITKKIYA